MKNVTFTKSATESKIMDVVFDAVRANETRHTKVVSGLTVEFVELPDGHLALVKQGDTLIGTAHVDEFDC